MNLHFEQELTLPLPQTLPPSVVSFIEVVNELGRSRGLQYFVAFWPLSHSGSIPLYLDCHALHIALVHWSIICRVIYTPTFGDKVASTRFIILGNHRTRSDMPFGTLHSPIVRRHIWALWMPYHNRSTILPVPFRLRAIFRHPPTTTHLHHDIFPIAPVRSPSIVFRSSTNATLLRNFKRVLEPHSVFSIASRLPLMIFIPGL